jgi:hypothetical protein
VAKRVTLPLTALRKIKKMKRKSSKSRGNSLLPGKMKKRMKTLPR